MSADVPVAIYLQLPRNKRHIREGEPRFSECTKFEPVRMIFQPVATPVNRRSFSWYSEVFTGIHRNDQRPKFLPAFHPTFLGQKTSENLVEHELVAPKNSFGSKIMMCIRPFRCFPTFLGFIVPVKVKNESQGHFQ